MSGKTQKEEELNDKFKEEIAIKNGIDKYIKLDCRESNLDYIKNSVMNSNIPIIFGFKEKDIAWNKCNEFATNSLVKTACNYKKENPELTSMQIANNLKISRRAVIDYLKAGNKNGWCKYDPKEEMTKSAKRIKINERKNPLICIELGLFFNNSVVCQNILLEKYNIKADARNIRNVCIGKRNVCGGLHFVRITKQEFNQAKSATPDKVFGDYFILDQSNQTDQLNQSNSTDSQSA